MITYTVYFTTSGDEYDSTISNTATETTDTDAGKLEDDSSTDTSVVHSTVSKSGENVARYTLYMTLFEFYWYDSTTGEWVQITASDFATGYYYGDEGNKVTVTNTNTNPMSSDNTLVTGSGGTISISSTFSYTDEDENTFNVYYSWYSANTLYRVVEISAPEGYLIGDEVYIYFYWSDDDDSTSVTIPSEVGSSTVYDLNATSLNPTVYVENTVDVKLPSTGGMGTWSYTLAGLTLCGGAVLLLVRKRWQA